MTPRPYEFKPLDTGLVLKLPIPPSVNNLYATCFKTKRRFPSQDYVNWQEEAGWVIRPQIVGKSVPGPISVIYEFGRFPDKRRRDLLNYEKATTDLLVKHLVIGDDSLIQKATLCWSDDIPSKQVRVTVFPCPQK